MSDTNLKIRFSGPELDGHSMDVCLLAPSLMAIGELCKEANTVLNGSNAKVTVLVNADVKANCVTVDLQVHQTLWQVAQGLISNPNVASAKEILEWLGIFGGTWAASYGSIKFVKGLIEYLRWKKERKEISSQVDRTDSGNYVRVTVEGNNNVIVIPEQTYKLSKSIKAVESIKTLVSPVKEENGIEQASFINEEMEVNIDQSAAKELSRSFADTDDIPAQTFTAHIVTHGPILDIKSKHWKFKFNNKVEELDISQTSIAEDAVARGGVNVGDTYTAKIEMKEHQTKKGSYVTDFKIKEVMAFTPGTRHQQSSLPL